MNAYYYPNYAGTLGSSLVEMHELLPEYWWALESEQEAAVRKSHSTGRQRVLDKFAINNL